ncbi:homoserine O-succinyltransferase [Salinicoccus hispanicus]|uniref:Homoserine O-acetyltransferase n=1 Tax=Salinicoccus hispanicus TaxID=157225 RepID=A0A6N8U3R6_9STAP|nr:homoserine O-succinyltransferase [Salinicoccus hispanicus]MXQ51716.1 homoserine O-succinyltransferase [Salinicoccus hispanicus]
MPIKIIEGLPVTERLHKENVYTIEAKRAYTQDIRPLRIIILNLMPKKEETELHLLRLLGNSPLQVDIDFMYMSTHHSRNTPTSHLQKYYHTLEEVRNRRYDGMIVTGAPVETLDFEQVNYIEELREIVDWSETHVFSRFFICWGAQFALNHYFGIQKSLLPSKLFGIFDYDNLMPTHSLMRGFDDTYRVPQSRHTQVDRTAVESVEALDILSSHPTFGPDILCTKDQRNLFIFGHLEYERNTLKNEYDRDQEAGEKIALPHNYFPEDNPSADPVFTWKSHGHLLFGNWINETYQNTYYDLSELE